MKTTIVLSSQPSPFCLKQLIVRQIHPGERQRWDSLMRQHHYLGFCKMVGESLRYVAEAQGQWLALLGWQAAALKCRVRDIWIGWPPVLQYQRLKFIANNNRFLILPDAHLPNLASRVLSLNLRRLSADWQAVHGHELLLAETFVDPLRFTGACYRAANWLVLGQSRGFAKQQQTYRRHDLPKLVLVYPLHRRAQVLLASPQWEPRSIKMNPKALTTKQMESLRHLLQTQPDCRHPRGVRHHYWTVLAIALAAVLCGARSYAAVGEFATELTQAQRKRVGARFHRQTQRYIVPTESTLRRVLQASDAQTLDQVLGQWWLAQSAASDPVAVDGKTVRGARRQDGSQVHLLSAFLHQQGVTVAQLEVGEKTNEIPELPRLLQPLDLAGRVVTADALHTQTETARFIVEEKKADYLFIVKDNQKTLLEDITALEEGDFSPVHQMIDKGHGRLETRSIRISTVLNSYVDFPYCGQVFRLERERFILKTGKVERETVHGITSLTPVQADPARLLELNRGHWSIENRSHYVRDMVYDEDRQQVRRNHGPQVMATLRNFAISLLRLVGLNNIAAALRACARSTRRAIHLLGL